MTTKQVQKSVAKAFVAFTALSLTVFVITASLKQASLTQTSVFCESHRPRLPASLMDIQLNFS